MYFSYLVISTHKNLTNLYVRNLNNSNHRNQEIPHGGGSTDMGDLAHIMPVIHPYVGGATEASAHTAGFLVKDYELSVIEAGKMMAHTVIDLLMDDASEAKKIIKEHKPVYSTEEYLKLMRSFSNIEVSNYNI